ncbi:MAG: alpha/beta fold hydrolase [Woeseiaceae bacterium]
MMGTEQQRAVRDIEVAFTENGNGDTVVMVHGLAEDQRSFADLQNALSDFHTYAYSFRGHGDTSVGEADGSLQQLGEDLIAFLEEVSGPARCIGYSLGGTVVLWAASRRPDLIQHVVIAGTSTIVGRTAVGFFHDRIELIQNEKPAFAKALRSDTAAQILNANVDVDAVTATRLEAIGDGQGYINAARAMIGVNEAPLTPELETIDCPVDVIGGEGDVFCPRKAADIIMAELKHGTYHEIKNAGHLISVDQPDAYAETIKNILHRRIQ